MVEKGEGSILLLRWENSRVGTQQEMYASSVFFLHVKRSTGLNQSGSFISEKSIQLLIHSLIKYCFKGLYRMSRL